MADLIFHDPTGKRARLVRLTGGLAVALLALVVAAFFVTLALAPKLPGLALKDPRVLQALHVETAHKLKGRQAWPKSPPPRAAGAAGPARPLAGGVYGSWDDGTARPSLGDHVN